MRWRSARPKARRGMPAPAARPGRRRRCRGAGSRRRPSCRRARRLARVVELQRPASRPGGGAPSGRARRRRSARPRDAGGAHASAIATAYRSASAGLRGLRVRARRRSCPAARGVRRAIPGKTRGARRRAARRAGHCAARNRRRPHRRRRGSCRTSRRRKSRRTRRFAVPGSNRWRPASRRSAAARVRAFARKPRCGRGTP